MANNHQESELAKYSKYLIFSNPIETGNKSILQLGKIEQQKINNEWPTQYILKTIKNVQVTQKIKNRLNQIRELPQHDNVIPVKAKGYRPKDKQVLILSNYFDNSQSLQNIVKNKTVLKTSQINQIFYQVIVAMAFLQQHNLNHLRLNPSAILVKFSGYPESGPLVRISDIGIYKQNQYPYQWCLHRDYFQQNKGFNPYNQAFNKECIKYDLWALGAIIYYVLKQQQPFSGVVSQFPFIQSSRMFKKKHVINSQQWHKKYNDDFPKDYLFEKLLLKCWGLSNQNIFKSWNQALELFQAKINYKSHKMEKTGIYNIFVNHARFIFLFSKIYMILRQQAQYKTSILWTKIDKEEIEQTFLTISECMFKICDFYHCNEFQKYFKHKCSVLPYFYQKMLQQITQFIENERYFLKNSQIIKVQEISIQKIIRKVPNSIVKIKSIFKQKKLKIKSSQIQLINKFMDQFLALLDKAKKILDCQQTDRFQFLNSLYQSNKFKQMAVKQFGFQMPTYNIFKFER